MLQNILNAYGLTGNATEVQPFGKGLINNTWLVTSGSKKFIFQRINQSIFKHPSHIAANIEMLGDYLLKNQPVYLFITTEKTLQQKEMFFSEEHGYFRLFPFLKNSHTIDVVTSPSQAFEAARQFGRFTKMLSGFKAEKLHITLPDFHNLPLRYQQFENAINNGNKERIKQAGNTIRFLQQQIDILTISKSIPHNPEFKKRVTHHDTKISNVLFDDNDKGLCVIDLDTVMPGYFISDVGDMLRTCLCPVSEEEKDFNKIEIRADYFNAIAEGYLAEMNKDLSTIEKKHFVYAGKFMIYMQALRFITDYINNDIYYGSRYEGHNLVRAQNQQTLLERLIEKEKDLITSVSHHFF